MFPVPQFVPPTLEQLTQEIDEITVLVKREAQLNHELDTVQKYHRDEVPLGVARVAADAVEEGEEEGEEEEEAEEEDSGAEFESEGDIADEASEEGDAVVDM